MGESRATNDLLLSHSRRERILGEQPRFSARWRRTVFPRTFSFIFESTPEFDGRSLAHWGTYVFWSGLVASALAGGLAFVLSFARLKDAAARDDLSRANAELLAALRERENMSRDLHDGALQSVYAIGLQLQHCRTALKRDAKNGDALMGSALQGLNQLVTELRGMLVRKDPQAASRPATLPMALREIADRLSDVGSAKIDIDIDENAARSLTIEESAHTLQIAREAMSNSLRHGRAQMVVVRLASGEGGLRLSIADDGVGFAATTTPGSGHGLRNMQSRAREIDAQFQVESQPGVGTSISMIYRARTEGAADKPS